ncbi:MAG: fatty acid metabolism transcriptional regulator FadR [Acidobacteriota bacterium]
MNNNWAPPKRPTVYAEEALIEAVLNGKYPPGSTLPGERDLAVQLGVTRPTLREVLQRLARDGWLTIRHGKPTVVNDYWREGGLNVLSGLVRYNRELPVDFVPNLLEVRLAMAPAYARAAVERSAPAVVELLAAHADLPDTSEAFASYDWELHHTLTLASRNPVYTLMLNGFGSFYARMARLYFSNPGARAVSRRYYQNLLDAARRHDGIEAERITRAVMFESISLWKAAEAQMGGAE